MLTKSVFKNINFLSLYLIISFHFSNCTCTSTEQKSGNINDSYNETDLSDTLNTAYEQLKKTIYPQKELSGENPDSFLIGVNNKNIIHEEKFPTFLKQLEIQGSVYHIDNSTETILHAEKQSMLYIPRNCFELENGKNYHGQVKIELKEVFSKEEMLLSNMQTISQGEILETGGMVYINAYTRQGKSLRLKTGKSISFEIPAEKRIPGMKVFSGYYTKKGQINWTPISELNTTLVAIPLEFLDFDFIMTGWLDTKLWYRLIDEKVKQPFHNNTVIATREFVQRFRLLIGLTSLLYSKDECYEEPDRLLKIYLENLDKDLWYLDSLITVAAILDSNNKKVTHPTEQFHGYVSLFSNFSSERLTMTEIIENHGIDLSQANAYDLLLQKGVSEKKVQETMKKYNIRQGVINKLRERKNKNYLAYAFEVNKLGWINIDRFYNIPGEKENIIVKINNKQTGIEMKSFVVFEDINSVVSENVNQNGESSFEELPKGKKIKIVVYGYSDGNAYFGYKDTSIGANRVEQIEINITTVEELKKDIKRIL